MVFQAFLLSGVLFLSLFSRIHNFALFIIIVVFCVLFIAIIKKYKHEHIAFLSIDYMAGKSHMAGWNTELKVVFALLCLFACISAQSFYVPAYLLLAMSLLTILVGKTPLNYYLSLLTIPAMFIALSCLAILVEFSSYPLGIISYPLGNYYVCITDKNQMRAFIIMMRSLSAVSCLYMLSLSTPVYRIIVTLRKIKVPSVVTELMYLIYRYIFIMLDLNSNMIRASASRLGYRNYRTSIKTTLKNAANLLFISFRQTSNMLCAMESRCYDGEIQFLHQSNRANTAQIIYTVLISLGAFILWILFHERVI